MNASVSIIICTHNRATSLRETLHSLAALEVPSGCEVELLVVDNASTDGTASLVEGFSMPGVSVRLLTEKRLGLCYARNRALHVATGDILLWTDDDVCVPSGWIEGMCRPIWEGRADAVAGRVDIPPRLQRAWMKPFHRTSRASTELIDPVAPRDFVGANMAFRRAVLSVVPAFDVELGPGCGLGMAEETLFAWQLREAGFRIVPAFDVAVIHHFDESRLSRTSYLEAAEQVGRSYAYIEYHWKHKSADHWSHPRAPFPLLNFVKRRLRLAYWRLLRRSDCQPVGLAEWEFFLVMNVYSIKQYLHERSKPRNYDFRGLVKRRGRRDARLLAPSLQQGALRERAGVVSPPADGAAEERPGCVPA